MSLICLMYHQIVNSSNDGALENFEKHLVYLKNNFNIVVPGDPIAPNKINVCLTFDDAYFDLYHHIYPLLKGHQLKAVVAIPTGYIVDQNGGETVKRLQVEYPQGLVKSLNFSALCSWVELREMIQSQHLYPASHSHNHFALDIVDVAKVETDVRTSQHLLTEKLGVKVDTFVYPFGKMNRTTHKIIRRYYQYGFRIGNASNRHWQQNNGLLYRVDADAFWPDQKPITKSLILKWRWNALWNQIRGK